MVLISLLDVFLWDTHGTVRAKCSTIWEVSDRLTADPYRIRFIKLLRKLDCIWYLSERGAAW